VSIGLNDTLNDLAAAIKIRENKVTSEELQLSDMARQVTNILESEILMNSVTIKYNFIVPTLFYPKLYLESILMNLISNAIKYKREDEAPYITIKTYYNETGNTVLECQDNGLGIDLKLHGDKVFGLYKTFHAN
jgi:light-regulated signal transduction histidine kinase (bacteriophytochrome)